MLARTLWLFLAGAIVCASQACEINFHTEAASVMVLSGRNATVLCDATSCRTKRGLDIDPDDMEVVTVTWKGPSGSEVTDSPGKVFSVQYNNGEMNRLMVMEASRDVQGLYVCSVMRNGQVVREQTMRVTVLDTVGYQSPPIRRPPVRRRGGRRRGDTPIEEPLLPKFRPVRSAGSAHQPGRAGHPPGDEEAVPKPDGLARTIGVLGSIGRSFSANNGHSFKDTVVSLKSSPVKDNNVLITSESRDSGEKRGISNIAMSLPAKDAGRSIKDAVVSLASTDTSDASHRDTPHREDSGKDSSGRWTNSLLLDAMSQVPDSRQEPGQNTVPIQSDSDHALLLEDVASVFQDDEVGANENTLAGELSGSSQTHYREKRAAGDDTNSTTTEAPADITTEPPTEDATTDASEGAEGDTTEDSVVTTPQPEASTTEENAPRETRTVRIVFVSDESTYTVVTEPTEVTSPLTSRTESTSPATTPTLPVTTTSAATSTEHAGKEKPCATDVTGGDRLEWPMQHESFFGQHGVAVFAVTLAVAVLLLYALLMVIFLPKILACWAKRAARNGAGNKMAATYRKRPTSIEEEAPMTLLSEAPQEREDTTLSRQSADNKSFEDDAEDPREPEKPSVSTFLLRASLKKEKDANANSTSPASNDSVEPNDATVVISSEDKPKLEENPSGESTLTESKPPGEPTLEGSNATPITDDQQSEPVALAGIDLTLSPSEGSEDV